MCACNESWSRPYSFAVLVCTPYFILRIQLTSCVITLLSCWVKTAAGSPVFNFFVLLVIMFIIYSKQRMPYPLGTYGSDRWVSLPPDRVVCCMEQQKNSTDLFLFKKNNSRFLPPHKTRMNTIDDATYYDTTTLYYLVVPFSPIIHPSSIVSVVLKPFETKP